MMADTFPTLSTDLDDLGLDMDLGDLGALWGSLDMNIMSPESQFNGLQYPDIYQPRMNNGLRNSTAPNRVQDIMRPYQRYDIKQAYDYKQSDLEIFSTEEPTCMSWQEGTKVGLVTLYEELIETHPYLDTLNSSTPQAPAVGGTDAYADTNWGNEPSSSKIEEIENPNFGEIQDILCFILAPEDQTNNNNQSTAAYNNQSTAVFDKQPTTVYNDQPTPDHNNQSTTVYNNQSTPDHNNQSTPVYNTQPTPFYPTFNLPETASNTILNSEKHVVHIAPWPRSDMVEQQNCVQVEGIPQVQRKRHSTAQRRRAVDREESEESEESDESGRSSDTVRSRPSRSSRTPEERRRNSEASKRSRNKRKKMILAKEKECQSLQETNDKLKDLSKRMREAVMIVRMAVTGEKRHVEKA